MKYEIKYQDSYSMLSIDLENGEMVKAESGAMMAMAETIDVEGKAEGGILKGLGRMLAGEKFFFQTLKANRGAGNVCLAPTAVGGIVPIELNGAEKYLVQKDGFLAGTESIEVNTKMQNLSKGLLSGEGFFIVEISGKGTVFVNSLGAIHPIDVKAGETVIIDNHHLVAWPATMQYSIEKASKGIFSSITSGEGLVCRFTGPGTVYTQTRNPNDFGSWVQRFLPIKGK